MSNVADLLEPLRRIHDSARKRVIEACETRSVTDLAGIAHDGAGDVTYAIDHVSETALIDGFNRELDAFESLVLIGEGLPHGRITLPKGTSGDDARWRILADPIDGTRGFMYQKRPAWILTGVAPNHGEKSTLADIEIAVQTEIPLHKQHLCDQLWAIRGQGAHAIRCNRLMKELRAIELQPSTATDLEHGYATVCRFFPGGRDILAALDDALCRRVLADRPNSVAVFEDQNCTAGQLYGLATGQDRFVADLRPLVQPIIAQRGHPRGHCCHPYDLCTKLIAEEAGVIATAPDGEPIDAPLDTESNVAWVGYANRELKAKIEPELVALLRDFQLAGSE
jgi:fructose-1,6-bisphosphatase/inositol monophosphatase family enzyme